MDGVVVETKELVVELGGTPRAGPATFTVERGSVVVVAGPNGAGKTTLLKAIAGLVRDVKGELIVRGTPIYIPQSDLLLPWKTLLDNIILPLTVRGVPRQEAVERAHRVSSLLGLGEHLEKYPRHASGGTRRKAAVARGLVMGADLLLLDEPFTGVDVAARAALIDMLAGLVLGGLSVMLVTHDLYLASRIADKIIVLMPPPRGVVGVFDLVELDRSERYRVAEKVVSMISSSG
ncbi:MAG: ATP-binding cassette domain-containing protein [Desulfurococcales archaeon]|nr:ATP-binding cassette domain-containing protein [Desulfurococcales archaeon]